ncbi:hypothetical protein [Cerasicoccus frondis]|uniref:hypothetical protein n=1 Tax=Cerasicoccus frondis TaxID=490090 RepID=UPI0028526862|nr:hypothetical protein [Cerasicoccus frondis]
MGRKKKKKDRPPRLRRSRRQQDGVSTGLDLIEESLHLLRRLPLGAWAAYLIGTVPFLIAFLYFWNEMSFSGLAAEHLLMDSLVLAFLFVWMRCWQALFVRSMWSLVRGQELPTLAPQDWLRLFLLQAQWQTTAIFALPILALLTFPMSHGYAFFQNVMIRSALPEEERDKSISVRAFRLAGVWASQGWSLLGMLSLLAVLLYWTWLLVLMTVPFLLKTLLGVDGAAIRSGEFLVMNSTASSIAIALVYLAYDPLAKGAYLMRCFYIESLQSGEDLLFSLRTLKSASRKAAKMAISLVGLLTLGFALSQPLAAETAGNAAPSAESINDAIDDTMSQPEYIWRFPKEEVSGDVEPPGWLEDFQKWMKAQSELLAEWLRSWFDDEDEKQSEPFDWNLNLSWLDSMTYVLIAVAVIAIVWVLVRLWQSRIPAPVTATNASAMEVIPDLNREDIRADELPRNRWLEIAEGLIAEGNYRLALRALFLAELSFLAEEGMIKLARYKSNLDYRRELMRRGDSSGGILDAYQCSANLFDGVWYGERSVGTPEIENMQGYLRNIGLAW